MAAPFRFNDFSYSGPVHKWERRPVAVAGEGRPQGPLMLAKWVKTGAGLRVLAYPCCIASH